MNMIVWGVAVLLSFWYEYESQQWAYVLRIRLRMVWDGMDLRHGRGRPGQVKSTQVKLF